MGGGLGGPAYGVATASLAAGVLWLAFEDWRAGRAREQEGGEPCAMCGGTGVVDCMCKRWSDEDSGCGSCNYSGKTYCTSCGGGGFASPIAVYIPKDDVKRAPREGPPPGGDYY